MRLNDVTGAVAKLKLDILCECEDLPEESNPYFLSGISFLDLALKQFELAMIERSRINNEYSEPRCKKL